MFPPLKDTQDFPFHLYIPDEKRKLHLSPHKKATSGTLYYQELPKVAKSKF